MDQGQFRLAQPSRVADDEPICDPHVAIAIQAVGDAYRWISVEGVVAERETGPGAEAHIDTLARAYDGQPWTPAAEQQRVRWHVRPTHIVRYR